MHWLDWRLQWPLCQLQINLSRNTARCNLKFCETRMMIEPDTEIKRNILFHHLWMVTGEASWVLACNTMQHNHYMIPHCSSHWCSMPIHQHLFKWVQVQQGELFSHMRPVNFLSWVIVGLSHITYNTMRTKYNLAITINFWTSIDQRFQCLYISL